jgi:hypothetical protein
MTILAVAAPYQSFDPSNGLPVITQAGVNVTTEQEALIRAAAASSNTGVRFVELTEIGQSVNTGPEAASTSYVEQKIAEHAIDYLNQVNVSGVPIWVYGNSYAAFPSGWHTAGKHYTQKLATLLKAGTVTSYGVGGKRIIDVLSTLINGAGFQGCTGVIAAGKWTSTTARSGLLVLESLGNDIGHYPSMAAAVAQPAVISSANNQYLDGLKGAYRAALALMSSESRIEGNGHSATSGVWTDTPNGSSSNGAITFTTAAGAYREYSVTPPQSGPLAGKVFLLTYKTDTGTGVMAQISYSVDGGAATNHTPTAWEKYIGHNTADVVLQGECIAISVPVDGAAHTIRFTHAGSAGQLFYLDALLIPSVDPNPIAVMEHSRYPVVNAGLWTQAQCNIFAGNGARVHAALKPVVAEFPNAIWVPSTMTANGLYSGDGLHPNDRGMDQRANDAARALSVLWPRYANRILAALPDNNFAKV